MAQSFTQIQAALDTLALTVSGINSANLVTENTGSNFAMQPDITNRLIVRTTLVPVTTTVETLGLGGFVRPNGLYVLDIIASQNVGYGPPKLIGDAILGVFTPGRQLTLTNGDILTIEVASPSPNIALGAKAMGKVYLT